MGGARRPLKGFNIAVNERNSGASSSFVSFMHMSSSIVQTLFLFVSV